MIAMATWDGLGPTIVGAVLGDIFAGVTVVIGARLAIAHERKIRLEDDAERAAAARKRATKQPQVELHNLRDIALSTDDDGVPRDFRLHLLRACLMLAEHEIGDTQACRDVELFLEHVTGYRWWLRDIKKPDPAGLRDTPWQLPLLKRDADALIAMLRDDPELATTHLDYDQNEGWVLIW